MPGRLDDPMCYRLLVSFFEVDGGWDGDGRGLVSGCFSRSHWPVADPFSVAQQLGVGLGKFRLDEVMRVV